MIFDLCARLGRDKKHLFQKLLPIEKVDITKLKFPMYASEKYDGVLREPRFKGIRFDKEEPDC